MTPCTCRLPKTSSTPTARCRKFSAPPPQPKRLQTLQLLRNAKLLLGIAKSQHKVALLPGAPDVRLLHHHAHRMCSVLALPLEALPGAFAKSGRGVPKPPHAHHPLHRTATSCCSSLTGQKTPMVYTCVVKLQRCWQQPQGDASGLSSAGQGRAGNNCPGTSCVLRDQVRKITAGGHFGALVTSPSANEGGTRSVPPPPAHPYTVKKPQ